MCDSLIIPDPAMPELCYAMFWKDFKSSSKDLSQSKITFLEALHNHEMDLLIQIKILAGNLFQENLETLNSRGK